MRRYSVKLEERIELATTVSQRTHNVLLLWVVINFASFKFLPKKKKNTYFFYLCIRSFSFSFSLTLSILHFLHNFETISPYKFFPICRNTESKISLYRKVPKQVQRSTVRTKINCSLQLWV